MKFTKITSAALVASMLATSAMAAEGDYYASVAAGYSMDAKKVAVSGYKAKALKGFAGAVGVGYYYTDAVRADVTVAFNPSDSAKDKASNLKYKSTSYAGLVNAYYDFTGMAVVPYVTAGVGAVSKSVKVTGAQSSKYKAKVGFAYQAGLGLGYEVTSGVMLDVGYRYTGTTLKLKNKTTDQKLKFGGSHAVLAGLRFSF